MKVLDENDIKSHIKDNHLPLILIDWNKITGKTGFYQGHMGVLTGFDNDNFFFHQSGPANPQPNMPIPKGKLMEAWNANETDNDIVIVYGKR